MSHARIVIGGTLGGSQGWSIGITVQQDEAPTPNQAQAYAAQAYADFLSAAWNTSATGAAPIKNLVSTSGNVTGARVYFYPTGSTTASVSGVSTASPQGGVGTATNPPQTALVVSLLSGFPGRHNRGRIYLPLLTSGVDSNLRWSGNVQPVAVSIANWLSLVRTRALTDTPTAPIVGGATATNVAISTVRVDNVLDTQRRRRDKISATATGVASLIVG